MDYSNNTSYIPHSILEGLPLKISIIKIWDESNVLNSLIIDAQKEDKEQFIIEAQVIINQKPQFPLKTLKNFRKSALREESILFGTPIKELSYNSMIAITIWSTQKDYDERSPLGSTTLSLFDENFRMREGKINLLIWPNVAPDIGQNTQTPGIVIDKNIENLNFCTKKIESLEGNSGDTNQNLSLSNLRLKLFYCYKTIPSAFLEIKLPRFPAPVLFEDFEYALDDAALQVLGGGYNQGFVADNTILTSQQTPKLGVPNLFIEQNEISDTFQVADFDFEMGRPDPVHEMYNTILRYNEHPETLQPQRGEMEKMKQMMVRPIIGQLKGDLMNLFWKYRYWASQFGAALPYVLVSTTWTNQQEEAEALQLMKKWEPIQIEDALFLLSQFSSANDMFKKMKRPKASMIEIRKHAVKALREFSDEKIENVLLQLVSALKYEAEESNLVQLLFERASQSKSMATYLFWYLHVEQDGGGKEDKMTEWYKKIYEQFCEQLQESNPEIYEQVNNQQKFRKKLLHLSQQIKSMRTDRSSKIQFLRDKLSEQEFQNPEYLPQHPCCLCPELDLLNAVPDKTTIFSSAMAPMRLAFKCCDKAQKQSEFKLIFKSGDDLRQDQLVMQIFNLMNVLLKGVSQDMKLLPYKIMACSKSDGFLEFVPETITIQDILHKSTIGAYLKQISEDPLNKYYYDQLVLKSNDPADPENIYLTKQLIQEQTKTAKMGINQTLMDNYILSSAGYCVLTYFLGVGDRHQENLLLNNEGKMFHIDFGFILGKDPKPYPPPFKLCQAQVEAMGGTKSEYFLQFKKKCVDVYNYLRKYAKLFIYILLLMCDAGIKDYSNEAIEQMYEKFRLDDRDETAEIHFLGILEDSVNSLFPQVTDTIHRWASYWRK